MEKEDDVETDDIYNDDEREEMLEDDEITEAEDAFMIGREIEEQEELGKKKKKKDTLLKRGEGEETVSVRIAQDEYKDD